MCRGEGRRERKRERQRERERKKERKKEKENEKERKLLFTVFFGPTLYVSKKFSDCQYFMQGPQFHF